MRLVDKALNTPGLMLFKAMGGPHTVQVFAAYEDEPPPSVPVAGSSSDAPRARDPGVRVRLALRQSGMAIHVDAESKRPITLHIDEDDEVWIASQSRCMAWVVPSWANP